MSLRVLAPGLLTTVQDLGRCGFRELGVGRAGAADAYSLAIANRLVGNAAHCAGLEITLRGPRLRTQRALRIALCGGTIDARCDGMALPGWRPIDLPAGVELELGALRSGCRSYLAIAGGIEVARVLGSAATDLRGGFGGCHGRALATGDVLAVGDHGAAAQATLRGPRVARWSVDSRPELDFAQPCVLRVMAGGDAIAPPNALFERAWRVDATSNRQGLRLQGDTLHAQSTRERISSPVVPGTVQLPPDGQPIVLLADAQTVGGYPRIGQLAEVDLPRAAQLRPGERVHFRPCSVDEAWQALCAQQHRLARLEIALAAVPDRH